jgi:DNA helicase II / ATP-dependent DNA helicase PcrA
MAVSKSQSHPAPFVPDDHQREAIEHVHGSMMVVAGAGTGKTSVLIHRIARLVEQGHAKSDEVLALTYTVAAATEMRDRVRALVGKPIHSATFHDYCNDLLIRAGKKFGVLDEKDLWIYLRKRIHELHLEHYVRAANVGQFLSDLLGFLSRCHDELVTPERYAEYVARLERGETPVPRVAKSKEQLSDAEVIGRCQEIARVFATTERWLREENLGTFAHMITRAHQMLASDEKMLAAERARVHFILVDEFQDANFAQIKILALLAGTGANVFGVGDPDQAIYRFRGASSAAFHLFRRHFPETKLVVLGQNRRSTSPILQCAFAVVDKNPPVFAERDALAYRRTPLQSAREEEAKKAGRMVPTFPVEAISFGGKDAEAPDVASLIEETRRRLRCRWKDFGVLYRLHSHRDDVVQQLAEREIPFSIENMDVSDTPEVRDLFACVAVVVDLGSDAALFRVAALPQFDVDPEQLRAALRAIAKESRDKDGEVIPLASVLDEVAGGRAVLESVRQARDEVSRKGAKTRVALQLIAEQFQLDLNSAVLHAALKFAGDWERKATTKSGELGEWIEYLNYFREAGGVIPMTSKEDEDAVRLMTVHGAKGLEFAHVFILRATSPSFPASYRETLVEFPGELRDPDSAAGGDDKTLNPQEERRLFYVAMTRARDSLHVYGKQGTGRDKTPPGFMRELINNPGLQPWLRSRAALPSQPELIDIAAAADATQLEGSRLAAWLALPAIAGLDARLSATAVETYETCPLQFKFEREWKLARQVHAAMQYGAAMHRVLRTYYDSLRLGKTRSDGELLQLFRDDLTASGIQDDYQRELYLKQGIEQLQDFLAGTRSAPPREVLHTEEWFDVQIAGTKVAGRIDRMDRTADGSVAIVDYKTGKARSQEDADESLQLSIYAMAAREKWGYRVGALVFHNLEGNVPVISRRSEFQLESAREQVLDVARGIAAGNFEPKVGRHCNFCAFRGLCPAQEKWIPNPSLSQEKKQTKSGTKSLD